MAAFIDVTCKCGKRIGWYGTMVDRPCCPKCGYRPPDSELEATDQKTERMRELMLSRPDAALCREQRVMAGLTLRQAAKQLGIVPSVLSDYEAGRADIPEAVKDMMAKTYGCGES